MPATERAFSHVPPLRLYVDTDVLVGYLVSTHVHHERSRALIERLAEYDLTTIYISSLSWLEFAQVVMRERFRRGLPDDLQRLFRFDKWEEAAVRRTYLQAFLEELELLRRAFVMKPGRMRSPRPQAARSGRSTLRDRDSLAPTRR